MMTDDELHRYILSECKAIVVLDQSIKRIRDPDESASVKLVLDQQVSDFILKVLDECPPSGRTALEIYSAIVARPIDFFADPAVLVLYARDEIPICVVRNLLSIHNITIAYGIDGFRRYMERYAVGIFYTPED